MRLHRTFRVVLPCATALAAAAACASGMSGGSGVWVPGSVSGRVVDVAGSPIANAAVRASGGAATVTDGNGEFRLPGLPAGQRARVNVSAANFAETTKVFPVVAGRDTRQDAIVLISQGAPVRFDARAGTTLSLAMGGQVRIPANALVRANGQPAAGMAVAQVATIDPRDFGQLAGGPGELSVGSGAQQRPLVSGGMLRVQLTDEGTGERLDLAPGQRAEIQLPADMVTRDSWPILGERDQGRNIESDTVPVTAIYLFDLNVGEWRWIDTLTATPGSNFVTGFTPTLGPWINLDKPAVRTCVQVQVLQTGGAPRPNVLVAAFGVDYNGYTQGYTDDAGRATLLARRNSLVLVTSGGKQQTVVTPGVETPCVDAGTL
ncbi:carboxypeptidase-like regulatory domain-containing protein [Longimicrobium sp.]|uniref:carboxypeptidase-like regulatory domain-containing protein n=1 Tax=Longimicrobium sp. TaxID=2029185 RepID=UPI003B3B269B